MSAMLPYATEPARPRGLGASAGPRVRVYSMGSLHHLQPVIERLVEARLECTRRGVPAEAVE